MITYDTPKRNLDDYREIWARINKEMLREKINQTKNMKHTKYSLWRRVGNIEMFCSIWFEENDYFLDEHVSYSSNGGKLWTSKQNCMSKGSLTLPHAFSMLFLSMHVCRLRLHCTRIAGNRDCCSKLKHICICWICGCGSNNTNDLKKNIRLFSYPISL